MFDCASQRERGCCVPASGGMNANRNFETASELSSVHVASRVAQVEDSLKMVNQRLNDVESQIKSTRESKLMSKDTQSSLELLQQRVTDIESKAPKLAETTLVFQENVERRLIQTTDKSQCQDQQVADGKPMQTTGHHFVSARQNTEQDIEQGDMTMNGTSHAPVNGSISDTVVAVRECSDRVRQLEQHHEKFSDRVQLLEQHHAKSAEASPSLQDALAARIASVESITHSLATSQDMKALQERLAELEQRLQEQTQPEVQQGIEHDDDAPQQERTGAVKSLDHKDLLSSLRCDLSLQGSMWDCCALVGFHSEGILDSCLVALGAALNLSLQMLFALIIRSNFMENNIDEDTVEAAKRWRVAVGHDIQFADPLTQTSLVSQICGHNQGLHLSTVQFQMSEDLRKYQNPSLRALSNLDGWLLCNLALILFFWAFLCDLRSNFHLVWAVLSQPRQAHPRIIIECDCQYRINGFSWFQVFFMIFFSFLPRLAVEIVLLVAGSAFLVYTENMRDLVMNAVALTFILDVDETSFSVLAPSSIKGIIERLEPIPIEGKLARWITKTRLGVIFGVMVPFFGLLFVNFGVLLPFREQIRDTFRWLCDGDVDFVYTINKASGAVYWTASQPFDPNPKPTYAHQALMNLTEVDDGITKISAHAVHRREWIAIMQMSSSDVAFASTELQCMDHLDHDQVMRYYNDTQMYRTSLRLMRQATGNSSIASCQDVPSELCSRYSSVRAACPVSCGCASPWSGLIFATEDYGCPSACETKWGRSLTDSGWGEDDGWQYNMGFFFIEDCAYKDQCIGKCRQCSDQYMSALKIVSPYIEGCEDVPKDLLFNMVSWRNYVYGFGMLVEPIFGVSQAEMMTTMLLEHGCEAVDRIKTMNPMPQTMTEFPICTVGADGVGRSARPWCPTACRCKDVWPTDKRECFDKCFMT